MELREEFKANPDIEYKDHKESEDMAVSHYPLAALKRNPIYYNAVAAFLERCNQQVKNHCLRCSLSELLEATRCTSHIPLGLYELKQFIYENTVIRPKNFKILTKYIYTSREDCTHDNCVKLNETIHMFAMNYPEYGLTSYNKILDKNGLEWSDRSLRNANVIAYDEQCILAMILAIFRADRTNEGVADNYYQSGKFNEWLKRLEELDKE